LTRRGSSQRKLARRESSKPYAKADSTGLTEYMGSAAIGFDQEAEDAVAELAPSRRTFAGKALSAMSFGRGQKGPQEITLLKPNVDETLGITFEVPEDMSLKGVLITAVREGELVSKSKKLKVGDVVHAINGTPVVTPDEGAALLRYAQGTIHLLVTRAGAKPKPKEGGAVEGELGRADKTRSFLPLSVIGRGSKKGARQKEEEEPAAAAAEEEGNTTVVVSCSQLIIESKRIVGTASRLDVQLDELYAKLKSKEMPSQAALARLVEMVGQTTVEQAGLVIANAQQGSLPDGWVEYFDQAQGRHYYYNVHTKSTTWTKPKRERPPPPPPPMPRRNSKRTAVASSSSDEQPLAGMEGSSGAGPSGSGEVARRPKGPRGQAHEVADALLSHATKRKMVETVQVECSLAPRHGRNGLVSVSL